MIVCSSVGSATMQPANGPIGPTEVVPDPEPVVLLVDDGGQLERSGQPHPGLPYRRHRGQAGGQPALHVGRAATVQPAAADLTAPRVAGPAVAQRDDVGVAQEQQPRLLAAGQPDRDVGPVRRDLAGDHVELETGGQIGEYGDGRRLAAGRIDVGDLPGRRAYESDGEPGHESLVDLVQDGALGRGEPRVVAGYLVTSSSRGNLQSGSAPPAAMITGSDNSYPQPSIHSPRITCKAMPAVKVRDSSAGG